MSDKIIGVAVLIPPTKPEQTGFLHFIAQYSDGKIFASSIPITKEEWYAEKKKIYDFPLWQYTERENVLHCSPSINDLHMKWHNEYSWDVQFVVMDPKCESPIKTVLQNVNPGLTFVLY
jgi:hypothetical protein